MNKKLIKQISQIKSKFSKFPKNEINYVLDVLSNNEKSNDYVNKLEKKFSEIFKCKYSIACNSGTSGLHASLSSLDLKPSDEVIVPALSVVMDPYAVIHLNATPVFADVDENTFLITAETIRKKITKKTKAVIVVSLQGMPVDIDPIIKLSKKFKFIIIEDNAQDFYGRYKNKISGINADIGIWSFENKKHLSGATEGGMIGTNNKNLATKIRKFAGIGYKHMTAEGGGTSLTISKAQDPDYERFDTIGLNYRMPEIVAAVCLGQLENFKFLTNRRKTVSSYFREAIKNCDWIIEQRINNNLQQTHYTFATRYLGEIKYNISWKKFYNMYKMLGGDGFYSACVCPHLEPSIKKYYNDNFCKYCSKSKANYCCKSSLGVAPIAEKIQKEIMQFKTNYRELKVAREKANVLKYLIKRIEQNHIDSLSNGYFSKKIAKERNFKKKILIGVVQGRLTFFNNNKLQNFPKNNWKKEFIIAKNCNIDFIEFCSEREGDFKYNPIINREKNSELNFLSKKYLQKNYSFIEDYYIGSSILIEKNITRLTSIFQNLNKLNIKLYILPLFEASEINEKNFLNFTNILKEFSTIANRYNIKIALECNLELKKLIKLIEKISHESFTVLYDTGNRIYVDPDQSIAIKELNKFISHVHIKDKNHYGDNVLLGSGLVDFSSIFDSLKKINYKYNYVFETTRGKSPVSTAIYNVNFINTHLKEAGIKL